MIKFRCPHCDQKLGVPDDYAGRRVRCSKCSQICRVPAAPTPASAPSNHTSEPAVRVSRPTQKPAQAAAQVRRNTQTVPPAQSAHTSRMISVTCLMCNASVTARQDQNARIGKCPKCGCCIEVPGLSPPEMPARAAREPAPSTTFTVCPSCDRKLPGQPPICTQCGIYIANGRPILTAWDVDSDELENKAHRIVSGISWLIPFGIYPVYSEALGNHRAYTTWAITLVTVLISAWFLALEISQSPEMMDAKNLMLWNSSTNLDPEHIEAFYDYTCYGDRAAFTAKRQELSRTTPEEELNVAALDAMDSRQSCFGEFKLYQLVTHAFLHGGLLHLAGNMLFLIVLGSRVNAAVGNFWMILLYPVLAAAAAMTHLLSMGSAPPTPILGASGAVMGLAGAYLLLFPIHRVHMVIWLRWGLLAGFHLSFTCFAVRGFWVVLFYIMFDVIAVSLMVESGTAHWAHIGGIFWGFLIALGMLTARCVYSGSDFLSLLLGKHAWSLIGTPAQRLK